jgi:P27 family predicted phage terminase small subunit
MPRNPPQPPLSIITPATTGIQPPRQLGRHGKQFWERVQAEYAITDAGGIELLMQACGAIDRAESLAEIIAREGEVIRTRTGTIKSHPAVRDELTARALVMKAIARLGIDVEPVKSPGRPPKAFGLTGND